MVDMRGVLERDPTRAAISSVEPESEPVTVPIPALAMLSVVGTRHQVAASCRPQRGSMGADGDTGTRLLCGPSSQPGFDVDLLEAAPQDTWAANRTVAS